MALKVDLVSPEKIAWQGEARMVIARTLDGDIAFLPGHVPFIGALATAPVRVLLVEGGEQQIAVHQGFVEVAPDGDDTKVTVLSDVCELTAEIDSSRAETAKSRAEAALQADPDDVEAAAALRRAVVRLEVARGEP